MTMRTPKDIYDYVRYPNTGSCETGAAQGWYFAEYACPGIKTVVVTRPISEVVSSILDMDTGGIVTYDEEKLRRHMEHGQKSLDKISRRPNVLTMTFDELGTEQGCKKIFEHCLPYEFDKKHWESLKDVNIQLNAKNMFQYYWKHKTEIDEFKSLCKKELRHLRKTDPNNPIWKVC